MMDRLDVELNDTAWRFWFGYIRRIGTAMALCHWVVARNPYPAAQAEAFIGKPTRIIPNYLSREQI